MNCDFNALIFPQSKKISTKSEKMTSSHGAIATPLESIASYRLWVSPSNSEVEFLTGMRNPLFIQDDINQSQYARC